MVSRLLCVIAVLTVLSVLPAQAELTGCQPVANCGAADTPCSNSISEGDTETLTPSPVAGAGVIRVRLCKDGDSLCLSGTGPDQQTVSVFGYSGNTEIYSQVLNSQGTIDTGPYTQLPGLTKLSVRCNSTVTAFCKVVWQVCREQLPLASPGAASLIEGRVLELSTGRDDYEYKEGASRGSGSR